MRQAIRSSTRAGYDAQDPPEPYTATSTIARQQRKPASSAFAVDEIERNAIDFLRHDPPSEIATFYTMARLIQHILEKPRPCSYLTNTTASLEHRIMLDIEPEELDWLLEHGYRRFGPDYFRPACTPCGECISTRVVVADFSPSRSQRRARNRVAPLRIMVGPPEIDQERLDLYHKWHADRETAREWAPAVITEEDYFHQFAFPHPCGRELAYYDDSAGGKLVAIGICDETPKGWSAVYCFYDPEYARLSIGTANVLTLIGIARAQEKPYVYLGYRVNGCASLKYKATFHPQEVLVGRPLDFEEPRWERLQSLLPETTTLASSGESPEEA